MSSTFLGLKNISFDVFEKAFPTFACLSKTSTFRIKYNQINDIFTVEFIGQFLFAVRPGDIAKQLVIYLPHYFICSLPNTQDIELIPANCYLNTKYFLSFQTVDAKNGVLEYIRNVKKQVKDNKIEWFDATFDCNIHNLDSSRPQNCQINVTQHMIEIRKKSEKNTKLAQIDFNHNVRVITTEPNTYPNIAHLTSFVICLPNRQYLIEFMTFDEMIYSFTCMDFSLLRLLLPIRRTHLQPRQASNLPTFHLNVQWEFPLTFVSIPSPLRSDIPLCVKKYVPQANYYVPEKATTDLNIVRITDTTKRTIIFPNLAQHRTIQTVPVDPETTEIIRPDVEQANALNELKNGIVIENPIIKVTPTKQEQNEIDFSTSEELQFLTQDSKTLFSSYFDSITINKTHFKLAKSIGIFTDEINSEQRKYNGINIIEQFMQMIAEFSRLNGKNNTKFNEIISYIYSIIFFGSETIQLEKQIRNFANNNSTFNICFPRLKMDSNRDILCTFFARLIMAKKLSKFITLNFIDFEWKNKNYSKDALINSPLFFDNFIICIKKLENINIQTIFQPKEFVAFNFQRRFDLLIKDIAKRIITKIKKDSDFENSNVLVAELCSNFNRFLLSGFLPSKDIPNIWIFVRNVPVNVQLNTDEMNELQTSIDEIEKTNLNNLQKLSKLVIKGLQKGYAQVWVMYMSKAAMLLKTHDENGLIICFESVMIVENSFGMVSSTKIKIDFNEVVKYIGIL